MTSLSTPVSLRGGLSASTGALALYRPHRQRDDRAKLEASRILDELETQLSKKVRNMTFEPRVKIATTAACRAWGRHARESCAVPPPPRRAPARSCHPATSGTIILGRAPWI